MKFITFLVLIILFSISNLFVFDYYNLDLKELINQYTNNNNDENENNEDITNEENNNEDENKNDDVINEEIVVAEDLIIAFLETGNKYTGDSIYIKAGDTDVLIDAGSRQSSSTTISNFLNSYVTDSTLEYVIATHAHQDHIAGFVGTKKDPGIFELYDCETIIDFPLTNSDSAIYSKYLAAITTEIQNGATHYSALECYNNLNGANRKIQLSETVTMEILYNYFYEHETTNENNYSVCVMIHHGDRKYLFTGDLEDEGEELLVDYNDLGKVNLYKAGHHGSYTAGSEKLLKVIRPDIVCICCCAGSDEYTDNPNNMFPAQDFISRICKYTDQIYVTTVATEDGFESLNGNIIVTSNKEGITINCTNNNTILKETEWFKKNRKWE